MALSILTMSKRGRLTILVTLLGDHISWLHHSCWELQDVR